MKRLHPTSMQNLSLRICLLFFLLALFACGGGGGGGGNNTTCIDADSDGFYAQSGCGTEVDCDDGNSDKYPGQVWYQDSDSDTYGNPNVSLPQCDQPSGYILDNTDCDDSKSIVGAEPLCADYYNSLGMGFNMIDLNTPVTFTMGSPITEPGRDSDETQHQVTLNQSFYMQTTEVTQGQWVAVMGSNPSYFQNCGDGCPVEQVSWNDAQNFITELNKLGEGTYRLPKEAEWEYVARSGTETAFANGDITETGCKDDPNLNAMGWYCFNSAVTYDGCYDLTSDGGSSCSGILSAGLKASNDWGFYDMHGNVWEWCEDIYEASAERNIRGGGWASGISFCRSANRFSEVPSFTSTDLGFRLIRNAP